MGMSPLVIQRRYISIVIFITKVDLQELNCKYHILKGYFYAKSSAVKYITRSKSFCYKVQGSQNESKDQSFRDGILSSHISDFMSAWHCTNVKTAARILVHNYTKVSINGN